MNNSHISCCGQNCSACAHFPHDCVGCNEIEGRVFWLEFVDEVICPIYNCCRNSRELSDCGLCCSHPCARYAEDGGAETLVEPEIAELPDTRGVPDEADLPIREPMWAKTRVS